MSDTTIIPCGRGLEDVTRDIKIQTGQFLRAAIEIGRLLYEAKALVEPGGWGRYIQDELPFSHSWANNYMKLYKEYGSDQLSLFGESQAFVNLRPTQALELLALPQGEREVFVQEHDVESMSTRELHKEIQEELEKARAELRNEQQEKLDLQNRLECLQDSENAWEEQIQKLQNRVKESAKAQEEVHKRLAKATARAEAAEKKAKESKQKLQELKKNPNVPESVMAELQQQARVEADRKASADAQKELDRLNARLKQAEEEKALAEETVKQAVQQIQLSDPDTAIFKTWFVQVQEDFSKLYALLQKISGKDPSVGDKLCNATLALLDKIRTALCAQITG